MSKIPSQIVNPNGLHQRYYIQKIVLEDGSLDWSDRNGGERGFPKFVKKPVDKDAEYFVMRLDEGGKDANHIKACRIGVNAYANAIEPFIPGLAKDLKERYPIESEPTPSVESMEDVLKNVQETVGDYGGEEQYSSNQAMAAMRHWASIKCAEKDREIDELKRDKLYWQLEASAKNKELATKEEAVKELVELLDRIVGSMVLERAERFDLNNSAKYLITKHKTP